MKILKFSLIAAVIAIMTVIPVVAPAQGPTIYAAATVSTSKTSSDSCAENSDYGNTMERALYEPVVSYDDDSSYNSQTTIKILGIVVPFLFTIILMWIILHFRNEKERDRLRVLEASLRKDSPMPPEFYHSINHRSAENKLQSGICWIGAGLATTLFFASVAEEIAAIGLLPLSVGIAQITVYIVQSRRDKTSRRAMLRHHEDDRQN